MKLCQGGIAADASSVQGQSTYQGSFVNEKGEFLDRGKLRKIIAVVESPTPHKEKWHPRQQGDKSRHVTNPFMLILDLIFALKQHKKYLAAHV